MTQFWSVNYVYKVSKLKLIFWTCPKVLTIFILIISYLQLLLNIFYHWSAATYSELYIWILSRDCENSCFLKKNVFKIILYLFFFILKPVTSVTMVGRRKIPDFSLNNIFSVLSIGLQYTLSLKWPDFGLKFRVTIMPVGQSLKLKVSVLHEIFPFLKQTGIATYFLNLKIVTVGQ